MRELHQIGEYCLIGADGACVRDRLLGRLLDDSVVIGSDKAAPDADASDEDGTAELDELHQQLINIRQKIIEPLCSKLEEANCVTSVLDYAYLAL